MDIVVGSRVVSADGRIGRVSGVYATTYMVDWSTGIARTRVKHGTVQLQGRQPKSNAVDRVEPRKLKNVRRRLGEVIKQRMLDLGCTYAELAEETGIPQRTLSRLADGDVDAPGPYMRTLERLAETLSIAPGDFWEVR